MSGDKHHNNSCSIEIDTIEPALRTSRICSVSPTAGQPRRSSLGELGWVEGQTMSFDCISPVGRFDQVPALARELV
jgi:hypothetical protein